MTRTRRRWLRTLILCSMPILALIVGGWSAGKPMGVLLALAEPLLFAAIMVGVSSSLVFASNEAPA